jgi:isopentenyldiphosphate isomerase
MEIFDIVDEFGNPTGETVEREKAHEQGIRHRTVHIWISREVDGRKQVLLQKRAMNKDSYPGGYDTSSAGHIQAGDEPLESAIRELGEELGLVAEPSQLKFAGTIKNQYQEEFYGKMFKDDEIAFVYVYQGEVDIEKLTLQTEEVESVDWFDLEDTYQECLNHNPKFCVPMAGLRTVREYLSKS